MSCTLHKVNQNKNTLTFWGWWWLRIAFIVSVLSHVGFNYQNFCAHYWADIITLLSWYLSCPDKHNSIIVVEINSIFSFWISIYCIDTKVTFCCKSSANGKKCQNNYSIISQFNHLTLKYFNSGSLGNTHFWKRNLWLFFILTNKPGTGLKIVLFHQLYFESWNRPENFSPRIIKVSKS